MLLDLSEQQLLMHGALDQLLRPYKTVPLDQLAHCYYSPELRRELAESGFLDVSSGEGFGALDAALLVEAVARSPWAVEVAGSALVAPALERELHGPVALCEGIGRPTRYLAQARHTIIHQGSTLFFADLEPGEAQPVNSVLAYPLGVLESLPKNRVSLSEDVADTIRRLWRIGVAAEAAGLMRAALDLTVAYVKDRRQFGHPLADFQAIQHRLAIDEQMVSASFLLAMRAADTARADDAETAALYVQENMRTVIYDCHQFTGAMGVTLEYPLHLWTYRLKSIQGELGGRAGQAQALATSLFGRTLIEEDAC